MKACVIGGKGKVGNYLMPMLVRAGYEVYSVSRGKTDFYLDVPELKQVHEVYLTRGSEDFEASIAALGCDVVVDMICFTESDMLRLIDAIKGRVRHYVACGSLWYHGQSDIVPVKEEDCRNPTGTYGIQKLAMADALRRLWKEEGFPGTIVHPGHICAPGHIIINPQGNRNVQIFRDLIEGNEVPLPNLGLETLHHVHAEDIAGIMFAAIQKGEVSFGEDFHAASDRAVSLAGFCKEVASWYGKEANLTFHSLEEFKSLVTEEEYAQTLEHISRSPAASMEKVKTLLGYTPRSTYDTVKECLRSPAYGLLK